MKTDKNTFILYKSFYFPIERLSNTLLGKLFRALFLYQIYGTEEVDDDIKMPFDFFVNQFKVDESKYQQICEKRRESGKKGGAPQGNANAQKNNQMVEKQAKQPNGCKQAKQPNGSKTTIYDNEMECNEDDSSNKKNISKKESRFIKPTIEEIRAYAEEKGYLYVDAEYFWNFYESKNWYVGKNKMSKWRSAVANWNKTGEKNKANGTGRQFNGKAREEYIRELQDKQIASAPKQNVGEAEERSRAIQERLPFD